jgi:hypothetical protein
MRKILIILLFIPLVCKAETISESIATLIVKGIEFYSENKTTIDSVYQEVKPILTAAPEERKQLIIKTLQSHEEDLLHAVGTLCADTAAVCGSKEGRSTNRTEGNIQPSL